MAELHFTIVQKSFGFVEKTNDGELLGFNLRVVKNGLNSIAKFFGTISLFPSRKELARVVSALRHDFGLEISVGCTPSMEKPGEEGARSSSNFNPSESCAKTQYGKSRVIINIFFMVRRM